jgi:hypothetical protein
MVMSSLAIMEESDQPFASLPPSGSGGAEAKRELG